MRVEPTFTTRHFRHKYGLREDQRQSRLATHFHDPYGFIQLSCKIAWMAQFEDGSEYSICHACKLRIPQVLPVEATLRIIDYFDPPVLSHDEGDARVLFLPNFWRAHLTWRAGNITIVDDVPVDTGDIHRWLERRLVNCFAQL